MVRFYNKLKNNRNKKNAIKLKIIKNNEIVEIT